MAESTIAGPSGMCIHATVQLAINLAGNGHSTNASSCSQMPARLKNRPCRPKQWVSNAARAKRGKGEAYVSPSTGKLVLARSTGKNCNCGRNCFSLYSEQEKAAVIESFNVLLTKELQDAHLFGHNIKFCERTKM